MNTTTKNSQSYFPQLTGIRAVAAFMVYLYHYNPFDNPHFPVFVKYFFRDFHVGVNIFFVLSGFLICYLYYSTISKEGTWFYNYLIKRVARIYPMYFLVTTATFVYMYLTNQYPFHSVLGLYFANITFIKGFFDHLKFTGIVQGWSLTIEECFYFLAPLIFISSKKIKLILQPFIFIFIGYLIVKLLGSPDFYGFMYGLKFMMNYTFFGRCFEFYAGIYIALLYKKKKDNINRNQYNGLYTFGGIAIVILSIAGYVLFPGGHGIKFYGNLLFNFFILTIGIAIFFWGLLNETSFIRKWLSLPFVQLLGKSSYVFYLIHQGIIHVWVSGLLPKNIVGYVLDFIVINIIAIILYRFMEDPLNSLIRRKFIKNQAALT